MLNKSEREQIEGAINTMVRSNRAATLVLVGRNEAMCELVRYGDKILLDVAPLIETVLDIAAERQARYQAKLIGNRGRG